MPNLYDEPVKVTWLGGPQDGATFAVPYDVLRMGSINISRQPLRWDLHSRWDPEELLSTNTMLIRLVLDSHGQVIALWREP